MLQKLLSTEADDSTGWIFRLGILTTAVSFLTGGVFYFTTRGLISRSTSESPSFHVDPMSNVVSLEHGLAVYAANCAICHGPRGLGDGPSAEPLLPKPRDFSTGWFKLGTTRSGLPSDADLEETIRRGMLPAAMPPWPQLSDGEVKSVVMAVRHLAIEERVAQRLAGKKGYPRDKAVLDVHAQLDPGPAILLPPMPAKFDLTRGKTLYMNNCAACHDPDGQGKLRQDLVDNNDNPIQARDFTSGQFKGGNSIRDIAMRIVRGMPGSPMPANPDLVGDDLWSTAAYVKSFSPGERSTAAAQTGRTAQAK